MSITTARQIRKYPMHVKTRLDRLEYVKNVLELQVKRLKSQESSVRIVNAAHAEFYAAYLRFADIATRACEQGII